MKSDYILLQQGYHEEVPLDVDGDATNQTLWLNIYNGKIGYLGRSLVKTPCNSIYHNNHSFFYYQNAMGRSPDHPVFRPYFQYKNMKVFFICNGKKGDYLALTFDDSIHLNHHTEQQIIDNWQNMFNGIWENKQQLQEFEGFPILVKYKQYNHSDNRN